MTPERYKKLYVEAMTAMGPHDMGPYQPDLTPLEVATLVTIYKEWHDDERDEAAALALLDDPKPGLRVEGEGLDFTFCHDPEGNSSWWSGKIGASRIALHPTDADSFLKQAVKGGAKVVSPVSVPAQEGK